MYIEFACLDNVRAQLKQIFYMKVVCVRLEIMPLMCGDYRFSLLTVERLFILAKAYVKKRKKFQLEVLIKFVTRTSRQCTLFK